MREILNMNLNQIKKEIKELNEYVSHKKGNKKSWRDKLPTLSRMTNNCPKLAKTINDELEHFNNIKKNEPFISSPEHIDFELKILDAIAECQEVK